MLFLGLHDCDSSALVQDRVIFSGEHEETGVQLAQERYSAERKQAIWNSGVPKPPGSASDSTSDSDADVEIDNFDPDEIARAVCGEDGPPTAEEQANFLEEMEV